MRPADLQLASPEDVESRIRDIRKSYSTKDGEQPWPAVLERFGLSEDVVRRYIALQLDITHLVDARLRPDVNIDDKSVESYYNQELLPQLRQSGAKGVPLSQVTPEIKEVLTQQRVNQLLLAWLQNLRSGSDIHSESSDFRGALQ